MVQADKEKFQIFQQARIITNQGVMNCTLSVIVSFVASLRNGDRISKVHNVARPQACDIPQAAP